MQKFIVVLMAIFLAGCAGMPPPPQAHNNLVEKKTAEEEGWAQLVKASTYRCGASPLPPEPERAVEMSNCITGLVNQYVLPKAAFPDLVLSSRAEALRMAKTYAAGKMSPEEYKKWSENRRRNYRESLEYLIHQNS
jgi:hypothetical protein